MDKCSDSAARHAVRLPNKRGSGDDVPTRAQRIAEPVAPEWEWLEAIAGRFSNDFFAEGRNQPQMESLVLDAEDGSVAGVNQ